MLANQQGKEAGDGRSSRVFKFLTFLLILKQGNFKIYVSSTSYICITPLKRSFRSPRSLGLEIKQAALPHQYNLKNDNKSNSREINAL